jgi:hypothetical protein
MKRDMDMVRDLLLAIESDPQFDGIRQLQPEPGDIGITEANYSEAAYHLTLLVEAGMVEGRTAMRMPIISKLTWQGHEFLDDIRSPEIWRKAKEGAGKVGRASIGFLWDLAKAYAKRLAQEKLGLDLP